MKGHTFSRSSLEKKSWNVKKDPQHGGENMHIWISAKKYIVKTRWSRFLLVLILGISLLLIIMILSFLFIDKANVERYQNENYERIQQNITNFEELVSVTDAFCRNLESSLYALSYVERAEQTDLLDYLNDSNRRLVENENLFRLDSLPHKLIGRLSGMIMSNSSFVDVAFYVPTSGAYLVSASDGKYSALCTNHEEFAELIHLVGDPLKARDYEMIIAEPTAYATAVLYIIRRLESGSLLLCGIRREALASTLLAESSGRSYQLEQMILSLSNGSRLYLYEEKGLMDIGEQDLEGPPIQAMGKYTLMRYEIKNPSFRLIAVLRDSGTTRVVSSSLFRLTMLVNVLWIILVVAVCIYILLRVFRPLRAINEKVVFSPPPPNWKRPKIRPTK